jgi:hypothetical protein
MLAKLVPIDDPNCSRLLDFRNWKNVFQSSMSCGLPDGEVAGGESVVLVAEGVVELYLTIDFEGVVSGEVVLMTGLLRWVVDASWDLCGDGAVVWYEHGVEMDGWSLQPIAAVLSVNSVRNIMLCDNVGLGSRC